jgi:glyceraldehyde-3-phosphate dehydrogenase (NAD(P))
MKAQENSMNKVKVGVTGYGVIGQRLADVAPTLSVRALREKGMP